MICDLSDSSVGGDFSVVDDGVGENEKKGFPAGGSGAISPVLWVWVVKFSIPVWPENMEDEEQEMVGGGCCCFVGATPSPAVERTERGGRWCDGDPVVCCPAVEKERVKAEGFAGSYGGMMVFWSFSVGSFPAVDDEGGEVGCWATERRNEEEGVVVVVRFSPVGGGFGHRTVRGREEGGEGLP
ncbi:hypothetical protein HAX54_014777 [Datura stramonium]|uniref:Uncharacterized protein n=1 Tax=Datura stramonium TaxID=4076 RepID=A0ABS8Y2D0_DATST|nr:hypothetical protein [Datura stramonium]